MRSGLRLREVGVGNDFAQKPSNRRSIPFVSQPAKAASSVGEVDRGVADDLDAALGQVAAAPFEIALDGVGTFGRGRKARTLWVGVEACAAMTRLQAKVEAAVNAAGIPVEERKFTPHRTWARLKSPPTGKLNAFVMANDAFRAGPIPADRFHLYSSFLSASGAIHTVEASYALKG